MRDRIISEIRKFVADNRGQTPGIKSFEIATGIPRKEWLGKIWARWGDALLEAGFEPNALTPRMSGDDILEKLGRACLDFGRLPSTSDLRVYGRGNPDFPSTSTLENHYLTRPALVEALRAWVGNKPEFATVIDMLPAAVTSHMEVEEKITEGHVYLVKSGDFFKIGRSDQIERRMKEIRIALPHASTLEHTIQTDDPPGIEAYWHRRFADKRANGEWFRLSRTDVSAFKRRRFQ